MAVIHDRRGSDARMVELIDRQRRRLTQAAIGYIILLAFVTVALVVLENRTDHRLEAAQRGFCERLQTVRSRVNAIESIAFDAWNRGFEREMALAKKGPNAALHRDSAMELLSTMRRLRFSPPTDCDQAVRNPLRYKPLRPRPIQRSLELGG